MRISRKIQALALITSWVCYPRITAAEEVKILRKGQAAPANGIFYTNAAHAKLVAKLQTQVKRCELEKQTAVAKAKTEADGKAAKLQINLETERQKLKLTRESMAAQKKILLAVVPKPKDLPWYKSPAFVFWSGVTAGIVVAGLSTWGAVEIVQKVK